MICYTCRKEIKENEEHSVHGCHTSVIKKTGTERIYLHYHHWNCIRNLIFG